MRDRPTPETDAAWQADKDIVFRVETCRKLERERDEAIIKYTGQANEFEKQRNIALAKLEEAREELKHIEEYGTEEINSAIELRQKLAQALVDLDNMQDQRDLAMKVIKRLERERDEAREERDKLKQLLSADAENVDAYLGVCIERDEAMGQVKELIYIADRAIDLAEIDFENDKFGVVSELRDGLKKIKEASK